MPRRRTNRVADSGEFTLISSDNHRFQIPYAAKPMSSVINAKLDRNPGDIRLDNYDRRALQPVVDFLRAHGLAGGDEKRKRVFNRGFLLGYPEIRGLFDALLAAGDLEIPAMVDVVSRQIANRIKDKSVDWVKGTFEIKNDVPPGRVSEIESEHPWAFQNIDHDD